MADIPMLGFDRPDDACQDTQPLLVRWKSGQVVGGILAPLDPQWMKAHQAEQTRLEDLRSQGITVLEDWR